MAKRKVNVKTIEFDGFKNEAGSNSFTLTPKRWMGKELEQKRR